MLRLGDSFLKKQILEDACGDRETNRGYCSSVAVLPLLNLRRTQSPQSSSTV
jgi:hypothetical protein